MVSNRIGLIGTLCLLTCMSFAIAVDFDGDLALIGVHGDDDAGLNSVLAYVFDLDTSELEPGVYDIYLGAAAGGASQHLQITVTE